MSVLFLFCTFSLRSIMIFKCLWAPGVEPGEQVLELAAVVAALELAAAAVVVVAVVVVVVAAVAAVVVVVAAVAAACTAAASRPPGRQCCWWGCEAGWMRRLHSSPALAACFLRAEPEAFILNAMGRGRKGMKKRRRKSIY